MADPTFGTDRDTLGRYLRFLADWAGLRDWYLTLMDAPPPGSEDFSAQIVIIRHQHTAHIHVAEQWHEWDEERLRQTLLHELVHAHFEDMVRSLDSLSPIMGELGSTPVILAHHHAGEIAVEAISQAWAPHLPLPSVWKETIDTE